MNKKQLMAIKIGIVMVILTGLCAPWARLSDGMLIGHEYGLVFPSLGEIASRSTTAIRLDTAQLYAEWVFILLVTGGFMLLNKDERE